MVCAKTLPAAKHAKDRTRFAGGQNFFLRSCVTATVVAHASLLGLIVRTIAIAVLALLACSESKRAEPDIVRAPLIDARTKATPTRGRDYVHLEVDDESHGREELQSAVAALRGFALEQRDSETSSTETQCASTSSARALFDETRAPLDRCPVREIARPGDDRCWRLRVAGSAKKDGVVVELHLEELRAAIWWPHSGAGPRSFLTVNAAVESVGEMVRELVRESILAPELNP